ncbi:MAG: ATP-binding cassette domain-containing protein [Lachnoclostridium sp.]|nr:ATP-binding cassette domain-containing protein [Lachnoclostridium sp.]
MITISNLSYTYKSGIRAVVDLNSSLGSGLYLLLGENGAGKTTLLHLLSGLLTPSTGSVIIDGANVADRLPSTLQNLFFLPDVMDIPSTTIRRFAEIHSPFYPSFSEEIFAANLMEFGLTGNEPLVALSTGTRHKAVLAYILSLGLKYLFLDEPANGLDINSRKQLRAMLARCMDEDTTVIVSTHTFSDFEALFDGVMVIHSGRMVLNMMTSDIAARLLFGTSTVIPPEAIYFEQDLGTFHYIAPNCTGCDTDVDFGLLYSALLSPAAPSILSNLA